MALATYAITTLQKVKDYLGKGTLSLDQDTWLEDQINFVSSLVENRTHQKFAVQSVTSEVRNGNGRSKMRPLYYPIYQLSIADTPADADKIASVRYRDDVDSAWTNIETEANKIVLNNPLPLRATEQTSYNIELLEEVFPEGVQNIQLIYKVGYTDSSRYAEIENVVIEMVAMQYKKAGYEGGNQWLGLQSTTDSLGGGSRNITLKDMKKEWDEVLNRYTVKQ